MSVEAPVPGNLPLFMHRGKHFGPITLIFKDANGGLINLTGYTPVWIARTETDSPNTFDLQPVVTNAVGGQVAIEFTADQTMTQFPEGAYLHSASLTVAGQTYGPYAQGPFTVSNDPSTP